MPKFSSVLYNVGIVTCAVLFIFSLSGCVQSYPKYAVTPIEIGEVSTRLPVTQFTFRYYSEHYSTSAGIDDFAFRVKSIAEEAGMFERIALPNENAEYNIRFAMSTEDDSDASARAWLNLFGYSTLGIIPIVYEKREMLRVDVLHNKKVLKTYQYIDSSTEVLSTLVPLPGAKFKQTNLESIFLKKFFHDLLKDQLIRKETLIES